MKVRYEGFSRSQVLPSERVLRQAIGQTHLQQRKLESVTYATCSSGDFYGVRKIVQTKQEAHIDVVRFGVSPGMAVMGRQHLVWSVPRRDPPAMHFSLTRLQDLTQEPEFKGMKPFIQARIDAAIAAAEQLSLEERLEPLSSALLPRWKRDIIEKCLQARSYRIGYEADVRERMHRCCLRLMGSCLDSIKTRNRF
jgi:hypothetical protein